MRPDWCPDFSGERVLIVASGPSAQTVPLEEAKGKARFVAINESWRLCPWADVLYGADLQWWMKKKGVPDFEGLRVTQALQVSHYHPNVHALKCRRGVHRIITDHTGEIGDGRTSLFQAINLVVRAGPPQTIGLVGADMRLDYGVHWHGEHPAGLTNPRPTAIQRWRENIDGIADQLVDLGVTVLNLSPISTLEQYRKVTLQEFLTA
jgi:hypothetical protein